MTTAITKPIDSPPVVQGPWSEIGLLIREALERGQNPTELYALLKEERATQARRAYNNALARLQEECPALPKTRTSKVGADGVKKFTFKYANKADILKVARPIMVRLGLSVGWTNINIGGKEYTRCTMRHIEGHFDTADFPYQADVSGSMNAIQKNGSGLEYAERYSFLAVTGLATCDDDSDGNEEQETITVEQSRTLNDLVVESGSVLSEFLAVYSIDELGKLPAFQFDAACELLNKRIQHRRAKA